MTEMLKELALKLKGALYFDDLYKKLYATDASVYRQLPLAVAFPKDKNDLQRLITFARENNTHLIPRTAGTSLAGQCVGNGIVVDVSKHFTNILDFDPTTKQVTVQPGVIRDELNAFLKPHGLFFGPNTSTANRCMIGGMVGNNSSGTTSIKYGVTRDKVLRLETILSDGSTVTFGSLDRDGFNQKMQLSTFEGSIYRGLYENLAPLDVAERVKKEFPKPQIHRRNTGYALDALLAQQPFAKNGPASNISKILAGSEGTLAFTTEITLQLDLLPPLYPVLVAAHYHSIEDCLDAVVPAMQHDLYTCEMMDKVILDCTKNNSQQAANRYFINGDPKAILMFELRDETLEGARAQATSLIADLKNTTQAYSYPILEGEGIDMAMELRKAGLGLLGNMIGDRKAVACIEDTAVAIEDLAPYIKEFTVLMKQYDQELVYYAHAGAGEIHLRPILNLKKEEDVSLFKEITTAVAILVKKYKGSMSGEHGDGIVRSSYIPMIVGDENYKLMGRVKSLFDPLGIFNQGKIIKPKPIDQNLRYQPGRTEPTIDTLLDFSEELGILRSTEKCNGSGDCRKLPNAGGTMCPSYRATRDEKDSTRGRANVLREFLTTTNQGNPFNHPELKKVFDLCLSCKACATECPSNVDVATLKAEFEYQYQKENGSSLRTKLFAYNTRVNRLGSQIPSITNFVFKNKMTSRWLKNLVGVAHQRSFPLLDLYQHRSFKKKNEAFGAPTKGKVALYIDEFTQYLDGAIGEDAFVLLSSLGYEVILIENLESGRSYISKGFLAQAKKIAQHTLEKVASILAEGIPLVGIEPSAILTFKDEYKRLLPSTETLEALVKQSYLLEDFLYNELKSGHINSTSFTEQPLRIKIHGHCHQKALSKVSNTFAILNIPINYTPTIIPSGCCGMAGSFGYEKEHYELSMNIGEQTLFPAVRKAANEVVISANGTSCRHQIKDGTGKESFHPITLLRNALKN